MENVVVVTRIPVRPERADDAVRAIAANVRASHEEPGVLRMALHREIDRPGRLVIVEIFRSPEAYEVHMATPHVARVVEALTPLLAGEVESLQLDPLDIGDERKGRLVGTP
jgi:quinol monooxygenase YgiN